MIILLPAYGRHYSSHTEMQDDWHLGKDFKIMHGPYTSIRDYWDLADQFGLIMLSLNGKLQRAEEPLNDVDDPEDRMLH